MFDYLETVEKERSFAFFAIPIATEGSYQRHLLEKTADYELYCITWASGAETPFHGHPDGGCWMRVVEGVLEEISVAGTRCLTAGDTGFQKGGYGIHKIVAREASRSLHLYKPGATNNPSETP